IRVDRAREFISDFFFLQRRVRRGGVIGGGAARAQQQRCGKRHSEMCTRMSHERYSCNRGRMPNHTAKMARTRSTMNAEATKVIAAKPSEIYARMVSRESAMSLVKALSKALNADAAVASSDASGFGAVARCKAAS